MKGYGIEWPFLGLIDALEKDNESLTVVNYYFKVKLKVRGCPCQLIILFNQNQ